MSNEWSETPLYDQLIAERSGRGPAEFEGHESWDDSEEAREAYARGVAEAQATWRDFWGPSATITFPTQPTEPPAEQPKRRKGKGRSSSSA
jgi:hypothetical protein